MTTTFKVSQQGYQPHATFSDFGDALKHVYKIRTTHPHILLDITAETQSPTVQLPDFI